MANMKLRHQIVLGCGVLQLIFGLSMFICGILLVVWKSLAASFGVGFWGGIWALLTGALGISGGVMRKKGLETAFMVLSILAAVLFCLPIILISYATSVFEDGCEFTTGSVPLLGDMINRANSFVPLVMLPIAKEDGLVSYAEKKTRAENALISTACAAKAVSSSILRATSWTVALSDAFATAEQAISTEFTAIQKDGAYMCVCAKGYENMYGAERALLAFGILLFLVAIISASLACCAVCRCCGAIDDTIRPVGGLKTTVITTNGYQFQQAGQPVSYVNGLPIGQAGQFGQQQIPPQYGQNPPQYGQFGQQPMAQQPNIDPFKQSQQNDNYNGQSVEMKDFPTVVIQ